MKKILILLLIILSFSYQACASEFKFSQAQMQYLMEAQSYLNKLTSLNARFIQFNPADSTVVNGELFLKRPGKLVLRYSTPYKIDYFIIDNNFVQYDYDLDQVTRADAGDSPLNILLYQGIDLKDNNLLQLTNIIDEGKFYELYFINKSKDLAEEVTGLTLKFNKMPIELVAIKRVDSQSNATELNFSSIIANKDIPDSTFKFERPKSKYPTPK